MSKAERRKSERRTHQKGPVVLRGSLIPETTTDSRLLAGADEGSWVHEDPWRVLRIQSEFVEGFGALAELGPAVSVFGSARAETGRAGVPPCSPGCGTPGAGGVRGHHRWWPGPDGGRQQGRSQGRGHIRRSRY